MTSKLNVVEIVKGHCKTLKGADDSFLISDCLVFFVIPLILASLAAIFGLVLSDGQITLLVTFGAIFTALLLSVLVLVYDQEGKAHAQKESLLNSGRPISSMFDLRIDLLGELYVNISYSILISLFLIFVCFLGSLFMPPEGEAGLSVARFVLTPLAIFSVANLMLTIVMVVKRLHVLLGTGR